MPICNVLNIIKLAWSITVYKSCGLSGWLRKDAGVFTAPSLWSICFCSHVPASVRARALIGPRASDVSGRREFLCWGIETITHRFLMKRRSDFGICCRETQFTHARCKISRRVYHTSVGSTTEVLLKLSSNKQHRSARPLFWGFFYHLKCNNV